MRRPGTGPYVQRGAGGLEVHVPWDTGCTVVSPGVAGACAPARAPHSYRPGLPQAHVDQEKREGTTVGDGAAGGEAAKRLYLHVSAPYGDLTPIQASGNWV